MSDAETADRAFEAVQRARQSLYEARAYMHDIGAWFVEQEIDAALRELKTLSGTVETLRDRLRRKVADSGCGSESPRPKT